MKRKSMFKFLSFGLTFMLVMSNFMGLGAVTASAEVAGHVVISEAYGGGGNSGAQYKNDFIELYNPTSGDVNLASWKVQYGSAAGTTYSSYTIASGIIKAGGYFLIKAAAGTGGTVDLPASDATCTFSMSGTAFKVKLVDAANTTVDFIGAGTTANDYEGNGTGGAPAPAPSNSTSVQRKDNLGGQEDTSNGWDTDNNGADFYTAAPTPKNSTFGFETKAANPTATPASGAVDVGTAITLATTTTGASITYQLNDGAETKYTDVITLDESSFVSGTAVIKAKATADGMTDSDISTFTYTIKQVSDLITIAEARTKAVDEQVKVEGVVTWVDTTRVYIQDSTAAIVIDLYQVTGAPVLTQGDMVTVQGKINSYKQLLTIKPVATDLVKGTSGNPLPQPKVITAAQANSEDYEGQIVKIFNAALGTINTSSNTPVTDITGTANIYKVPALTGVAEGDKVDIIAIASQYHSTNPASGYQLRVLAAADVVKTSVNTIADARTQSADTVVNVMGIVTWIDGTKVYVQDNTAAIVVDIYQVTGAPTVVAGDIILVKGKIGSYRQLLTVNPIAADILKISSDNTLPQPTVITISQASSEDYEAQLVRINNVTLGTINTGSNTTITDAAGKVMNIYKIPVLTGIVAGNKVDVIGIASQYHSTDPNLGYQFRVRSAGDVIKADSTAPEIVHTQVSSGYIGKGLVIDAVITDDSQVTAKVYYRMKGQAEYKEVNMTSVSNNYSIEIPETDVSVGTLEYYIEANDGINTATSPSDINTPYEVTIIDADGVEPVITAYLPASGEYTGEVLRPIISIKYEDIRSGIDTTSVKLYLDSVDVTSKSSVTEMGVTYTPDADLSNGMHVVRIVVSDKATPLQNVNDFTWNFYVGKVTYKNYFGQLHSHTAENSDGSGTLVEAYTYARDTAKLDFFAVTDHSNSFDTKPAGDKAGTYNLGDYNKDNVKWQNGQKAAADARRDNFISVYAYEMTWSNGPGHINTFATDGFVSRNNTELNAKTSDAGMRAYYQLLKDTPNSISQFNHPGATFGTFSDFAYLDPIIDARISLLEVGNGEGAVGSGSYFPSYDEYNKALDKGWHVAPTNNQDNHKGKWGDSNTARTVIYTNDLSVNGLYDALRNMRVYATEDNNLNIVYTLNDNKLGTILQDVPGQAAFKVTVADPDTADTIKSISIITNGGRTVYEQTYSSQNAELETTINSPAAGYYYIKVEEEDGQIAVTAPIWLGSSLKIGIDSIGYDTMMPVTNEPVTFTSKLFNNESAAATVKSISYDIKGGPSIGTYDLNTSIASSSMYTHTLSHTFTEPGKYTITLTAVISQNGNDSIYKKDIEINIRDSEKLVYVGIDASHDNEYVAGNYKASMGNFAKIAAKFGVRVVELTTSEALISAMQNPKYQMMVFTVPSRRDGTVGRIPFKSYSQSELDAVAAFAKSGKTVIVNGWGDYYESYSNLKSELSFTADQHMAAQQNKLLAAIGASLRIADDEAKDNTLNGGQAQRLYLTDFNNYQDPLTQGIVDGQVFSQYGGSTIYAVNSNNEPASQLPSNIIATVSGHATTYSSDDDKDSNAIPPKYNNKVLLMANETVKHSDGTLSTVIAAGGAFMSNFEIQVEVENAGTLPYGNYNILQNIIASLANISTIAEVRSLPVGTEVAIEGIATTDVYNGSDSNKGFFDCIYVQDQTGGINLFPVSSGVEAGQKIRVTGIVGEYQGEKQIQNAKVTVINYDKNLVAPKTVTPAEAMLAENTGSLVTFKGTVTEIKKDSNGVVGQLMVSGARVYINGYITKNISLANIQVGDTVYVTGIASVGENMSSETDFLPRIRVRDRAEIVQNIVPAVNIGDDVVLDEGSIFTRTGNFGDSDADTWSAVVNYGDGVNQALELNADKSFRLSHTFVDNGTYQVTVTVNDGNGGIGTDIITVTVNNVAPSVGTISGSTAPILAGTAANFSGSFTDPGKTDTHTAIWNWGDGTQTTGSVTQGAGSGSVANSHTYAKAGIYTVTLTVTDDDAAYGTSTYKYDVVVYDPSAGYVNGSGWINSPEGAYKAKPQLKGKATFSLDLKYLKGAKAPTGSSQFEFKTGSLNFISTSFEWLVVTGSKAELKGSGTLNGSKGYKFIVTVVDSSRGDMFSIKIIKESTGEVIYDNAGASDLSVIGGGNITVHTK